MKKIIVTIVLIAGISVSAQVKIGTTATTIHAGAMLELEAVNKGLKFPPTALTSTTAWLPLAGSAVMGMTVYNTATTGDVTPGLYTNNGTVWIKNEGGAVNVPTWRSVTTSSVLILETDANNFVRSTNSSATTITLPAPTTTMIGKVFTVFETSGSASPTITTLGGNYKTTVVPAVSANSGYQFITDGVDWYCTSGY
jgi:hypothetical protein